MVPPIFQKVYVDTKIGTCTANSFPARHLDDIMASEIEMREPFTPFVPEEEMMTYVKPRFHAEVTHTISL